MWICVQHVALCSSAEALWISALLPCLFTGALPDSGKPAATFGSLMKRHLDLLEQADHRGNAALNVEHRKGHTGSSAAQI